VTMGSWDKNLPSASRFTILPEFNDAAVRDNNTGLVWERFPETHAMDRKSAAVYCANKTVGGTIGWRLPLIELKSLQESLIVSALCPIHNLYCPVAMLVDSDGIFHSCGGRVGCELRQQQ
jgi:hypothetical protein